MKFKLLLLLGLLCFQAYGQLDYKIERKIKAEEDSLQKADTIVRNFRMIKRIKYGFLTTFSQGNYSTLGFGINRLVTNSVGHAGAQINYEKNLNNNFHGINVGLFAAGQGDGIHLFSNGGIFNYLFGSINISLHSDLSAESFFCFKPEIGFEFSHCILTYLYTWSTPKENKIFQNTHAVNFKYYLTFYRKKKCLLYDW